MSDARPMLDAYPGDFGFDADALAAAIDALSDCAQACVACADACLAEEGADRLRRCIHRNLDCSDVCGAAVRVLSRQAGYDAEVTRSMLEAAVQACRSCAAECESHAGMHAHCRLCAEACRRAEAACAPLVASAAA